jgi:hypothetical protein
VRGVQGARGVSWHRPGRSREGKPSFVDLGEFRSITKLRGIAKLRLVRTDWELGIGVQNEGVKSSAVTFRARIGGKYKPQGGVRFRSSSTRKESSGERERGARPCGVTVRGCVLRASLRRIPKEVADCLKFVVCLLAQRGEAVGSYIGWRRGVALDN